MDLGRYTIRESFKAQWKGTQNKSKIIQEIWILLHFIYWNYRLSWKTVLDGKELHSIENSTATIKTEVVSFKRISPFSEQIHDGENACVDRLNILM
jgi:exonuclease SbcC